MSGARGGGFSLLEVIVALMILQVSLLGVLGTFTVASSRLTRALLVERATAEVAAVADSLSMSGLRQSGGSVRGDWRVSWSVAGVGMVVRAALIDRDEPVVEVEVP